MITSLWGKKIGMTQLFVNDKLVPVTVIDVSSWLVTQLKTEAQDGYQAVQIGCLRDRYVGQPVSADWFKKLKQYFLHVREVKLTEPVEGLQVGSSAAFLNALQVGDKVDVAGNTKGSGFAGVVNRWGFSGGRSSHGSKLGRKPGSGSSYRSQGRIIKGKRFPGHMGNKRRMMKSLEVVKVQDNDNLLIIKGSVPGKSGSLLFIRKA